MPVHLPLSVVVPMFNEEAALPLFVPALRRVLDELGEPYEVIAVDDGSSDGTASIVYDFRRSWPELRLIRLRRNSGHQAALAAGLFHARGEYLVSIDADLQDPPEVIPRMLRLARADQLDVVHAVREDRSTDTALKRWSAEVYYRLIRRLVGPYVRAQAGDFRLVSRRVVETLRTLPDPAPVLRLVIPWLGFPGAEVGYVRQGRVAGRTKYGLGRMVRLATDSVTSFSAAPLRLATWLGLGGVVLCAVLTVIALVAYVRNATTPGWASLYVAVLFLGAVQLLCLGLLGEYVGRIYTAVQGRPAYLIESDSGSDLTAADLTAQVGPSAGSETAFCART
jgi:dolichol-phosphate mannosyltransferase